MMKKALMTAIFVLAGLFGGAHAQLIPAWSEAAPVAAPIIVGQSEMAVTRVVSTTHITGQGSAEGLSMMQETLTDVSLIAEGLGRRCSSTTMQGGPIPQSQMVMALSLGTTEVTAPTEDLRVFRSGNTLRFTREYPRGTISGECLLK